MSGTATSDIIRLEHANFSCSNLDQSREHFQKIFPDWRIRTEGINQVGRKWIHLGNDQVYVSLTDDPDAFKKPVDSNPPAAIRHIGFVIRDGAAMIERLKKNNIHYGVVDAPEAKYRIYVYDPDGREIFELLEYNTDYALK